MDELRLNLIAQVPENTNAEFLKAHDLFYYCCVPDDLKKKAKKELDHTIDLFGTIISDINQKNVVYEDGFIVVNQIKIDLDTGICSLNVKIPYWREKKFILLNVFREIHFRKCVDRGLLQPLVKKGKEEWPPINLDQVIYSLL